MIRTEQILREALHLSEAERLFLATKLIESLPPADGQIALDNADLLEELDRRFADLEGLVPADRIWDQE